MKVVLLAGGLGTRLSEETETRPKPLVEIGGKPIIWHIMKIFSTYGFHDFIICAGYKGYMIKEYFANYSMLNSNLHGRHARRDRDTGAGRRSRRSRGRSRSSTPAPTHMTGGRIKRILPYLGDDPEFLMTYGDGVADVDVPALIAHHRAEGRLATVTGRAAARPVRPAGAERHRRHRLPGKAAWRRRGWINGGFFVLPRSIGDYIEGDATTFEREPLERLSRERQLTIYQHEGFWLPMDSLRDKTMLEGMWTAGNAPWKIW